MPKSLEERVMAAAGAAVTSQKYVAPIDVLMGSAGSARTRLRRGDADGFPALSG
jgi:hypothetical protein